MSMVRASVPINNLNNVVDKQTETLSNRCGNGVKEPLNNSPLFAIIAASSIF